jgi:hypothetical protein
LGKTTQHYDRERRAKNKGRREGIRRKRRQHQEIN